MLRCSERYSGFSFVCKFDLMDWGHILEKFWLLLNNLFFFFVVVFFVAATFQGFSDNRKHAKNTINAVLCVGGVWFFPSLTHKFRVIISSNATNYTWQISVPFLYHFLHCPRSRSSSPRFITIIREVFFFHSLFWHK